MTLAVVSDDVWKMIGYSLAPVIVVLLKWWRDSAERREMKRTAQATLDKAAEMARHQKEATQVTRDAKEAAARAYKEANSVNKKIVALQHAIKRLETQKRKA